MDRGTCSCRDYEINTYERGAEDFYCKHRHAVDMKRRWLKQTARACAPTSNFPKEAA